MVSCILLPCGRITVSICFSDGKGGATFRSANTGIVIDRRVVAICRGFEIFVVNHRLIISMIQRIAGFERGSSHITTRARVVIDSTISTSCFCFQIFGCCYLLIIVVRLFGNRLWCSADFLLTLRAVNDLVVRTRFRTRRI